MIQQQKILSKMNGTIKLAPSSRSKNIIFKIFSHLLSKKIKYQDANFPWTWTLVSLKINEIESHQEKL